MADTQTFCVFGSDGLRGTFEDLASLAQTDNALVAVRLEDGRRLWIPRQMLTQRNDGAYSVPFGLKELEAIHNRSQEETSSFMTIPVIREEASVEKQVVQTGRARIHKKVVERQETWDEPLEREEVEIERVPVNQIVCDPVPTVRQEGDVLILPLLEEVLVVEKRVMLKEEVHIRRRRSTFHHPVQVSLRSEEVRIERAGASEIPENALPQQESQDRKTPRHHRGRAK
ncbi:MAG TPA: YsnF/AvaK domain-containing protein [Chthonomonadaceae bacterium]|nr:YsnF/AvaK domain-containing protein [Chthonomonadaceae bacterium]